MVENEEKQSKFRKKKKKKQEMIPEESISWSKGRETVKLDLLKKKMVRKKMVLSLGH